MGPRRDTDATEDPARSADSLESLLRSTERDTAEIVEALRESGPRQHVSETSVDDVLADLSRSAAGESEGPFALSGGPTRTVSTSGIDEVFETLEAQAPPLPPEPQVGASRQSTGGDSAVNGSGGASTAMAANSSGGSAASVERSPAVPVDSSDGARSDDAGETFGTLVGGEPTRTVSEESVDEILDRLEDEPTDSDAGPPAAETDAAIDDLRPADPEGELVDLLTDEGPDSAPTAADSTGESAAVEPTDGSNQVADAVERLTERRSDDPDPSAGSSVAASPNDDAFEWVDPETGSRDDEDAPAPAGDSAAVDSDAVAGASSRPLVTRAELEEIAALATESDPGPIDEPASGPAADSGRTEGSDRGRGVETDASAVGETAAGTGEATVPSRRSASPASVSKSDAPRESVTVDAVIAPTDASLGEPESAAGGIDERTGDDVAGPATDADRDESTDASGQPPAHPESVDGRILPLVRRLVDRLRR